MPTRPDNRPRARNRPKRGKPVRCGECQGFVLWDESIKPNRYACEACGQRYQKGY